jgi:hypothetical protein
LFLASLPSGLPRNPNVLLIRTHPNPSPSVANTVYLAKVGIRNLSPHLRNSAILRTPIEELRTKKSCGTAIADLENLTFAIPQLSTVSCLFRYFLDPFPQLRMVLKINPKYF